MLIGNLGKDPEVQYLEKNIGVAKFPLATTETHKDKNGKLVSQTEWHIIVLWRGLAELAQKYLHKGSLIYVEGRLRTRSWEDREGNKKFATEIVADNLIMLDKRNDGNVSGLNQPMPQDDDSVEEFGHDEPPASDDDSSGTLPY
jgi:single-strand DNA-binding protein